MQHLIELVERLNKKKAHLAEINTRIKAARNDMKGLDKTIEKLVKQLDKAREEKQEEIRMFLSRVRMAREGVYNEIGRLLDMRTRLGGRIVKGHRIADGEIQHIEAQINFEHVGMKVRPLSYSHKKKLLQVAVLEGGQSHTRYLRYDNGTWIGTGLVLGMSVFYTITKDALREASMGVVPASADERQAAAA